MLLDIHGRVSAREAPAPDVGDDRCRPFAIIRVNDGIPAVRVRAFRCYRLDADRELAAA